MPEPRPPSCGWRTCTVDTLLTTRPCILHGVLLIASVAGGDVTMYEGQDTSSGRQIAQIKALATATVPVNWNPGLLCERGLYVDVGSNVTEVHVYFTELPAQVA